MKIKVMTFNIQHCRNFISTKIDTEAVSAAIAGTRAQICGLNEVRSQGTRDDYTDQTATLSAQLGFFGAFLPSDMIYGTEPYGNAVVSAFPIVKKELFRIPEKFRVPEHRAVLRCEFDVDDGFAVYQTHFGLKKHELKSAAEFVYDLFIKEDLPAVLMGDFNMAPSHPSMKKFMTSTEIFCAESTTLTFPSDEPEIKIDYIFANSKVQILDAQVLPLVVSDHRPMVAEIEF